MWTLRAASATKIQSDTCNNVYFYYNKCCSPNTFHFVSLSHTHTHSHTQCMPVANSQSSAVFRCNKLSAKNLWCKMPSKRPAMTSSKCIVTVCLSACGLWRTRGAGNDGDNKTTTTRMKTEGKNKRHEHGTIFEFSVCASWQRQL